MFEFELTKTELGDVLFRMNLDEDAVLPAYNGRGMYGATTVAIKVDDHAEARGLYAILGQLHGDVGVDLARAAAIDNLGDGYVVYWPYRSLSIINDG